MQLKRIGDGSYEVEGLNFKFRLNEWRVGDVKDSVQLPATITAGTKLVLFRDVTNKNLQHNNQDNNAGRLSAHTDLIINRISVHPAQAFADTVVLDTEIIKLVHSAALEVFINQRKVTDGALYQYPSGYGVTGSTTRNNTGVVTNGTANYAAAPQLLVAQKIGPSDSFKAEITFYDNAWLASGIQPSFTNRMVVTCLLEGLLKKDATA